MAIKYQEMDVQLVREIPSIYALESLQFADGAAEMEF